jgi:heme/copper-type cytochrome/quinol oxidase subunit 2
MLMQYVFEIFYLAVFAVIISFIVLFYVFSRKAPKAHDPNADSKGEVTKTDDKRGMERNERNWLYFLLAVVLLGNLVTLSPLIPSANYGLWTQSTPVKTITIEVDNYHFTMPQQPITVPVGKVVEFVVVSHDVTYGFGVFRKDGTMVFQMQVVPEPYKNTLLWVFDQPGMYDVRSTEYSGPQNPLMYVPNAIQVEG